MSSERLQEQRELAARRRAADVARATVADVYSYVRSMAGHQLQDRTRIHEIQEQLDRIEGKLDVLTTQLERPAQSRG